MRPRDALPPAAALLLAVLPAARAGGEGDARRKIAPFGLPQG